MTMESTGSLTDTLKIMISSPLACLVTAAVVAATGVFRVAVGQEARPESRPFFQAADVVALVGGEDVVVMRDDPRLELLVLRQPGLAGVKFRNLAFEGDTVFEQFRDLNFPTWEDQMQQVGATVVVAQFGKMESLDGPAGVPAFARAYEQLIDRMAGGTRRVGLLAALPPKGADPAAVAPYNDATRALAARRGWVFVDGAARPLAEAAAESFGIRLAPPASPELVRLVRKKNELWFHYWRPQNWAFLNGDRTEQQSSRDHRDPKILWFPEEMKRWLPLVAAREKEIQETIETDRKP